MMQGMSAESVVVDGIFRALADPTRRDVVERLSARPSSVSELASAYDMALPSFIEHLKMLEGAGLVSSEKVGRVRTYALVPEQFDIPRDWLSRQRSVWEGRLNRLDAYLLSLKKKEKPE